MWDWSPTATGARSTDEEVLEKLAEDYPLPAKLLEHRSLVKLKGTYTDKLAQLARGREFEPFDRSLDVQISRLRKLIEQDAASPRYIQTVWGVGYVFVPDGVERAIALARDVAGDGDIGLSGASVAQQALAARADVLSGGCTHRLLAFRSSFS